MNESWRVSDSAVLLTDSVVLVSADQLREPKLSALGLDSEGLQSEARSGKAKLHKRIQG